MQPVTKADYLAVLSSLGVRTDYSKLDEKVARAEATPWHTVAEINRIRGKYSKAKFKDLRFYDGDKQTVNRLEDMVEQAQRVNRVSCSLTIARALKTILKTLPYGSEVEIEFDWDLRYPFRVRWMTRKARRWVGRMNLVFEQKWLRPVEG
jgi:hypothetical protein